MSTPSNFVPHGKPVVTSGGRLCSPFSHVTHANPCPPPPLQIELGLDSKHSDMEERVEATLASFRRNFGVIMLGKSLDKSGAMFDAAGQLIIRQASKPKRERHSSPRLDGPEAALALAQTVVLPVTPPPSLDAARSEGRVKGTTLFDQILRECRSQVYDPVLGAYLPKHHPTVLAQLADPQAITAHPLCGLDGDFAFVKVRGC
jgi:hypothetical protein